MKNTVENFDLNVTVDTVLLFDMDGTLIDTDLANFLAYKNAIRDVILGREVEYDPNERFNREALKTIFPNLTYVEYEGIIKKKEENYKALLSHTKLNSLLADTLTRYSKTNRTVLVTNSLEDRALLTLNYHNVTDKFHDLVYRQSDRMEVRTNKYHYAITNLKLSGRSILVFENDSDEIEDAIAAGISVENILSIL
jgi:beta-phosphoglucomutase